MSICYERRSVIVLLGGRRGFAAAGEKRWERKEVTGAVWTVRDEGEDFRYQSLLNSCVLKDG